MPLRDNAVGGTVSSQQPPVSPYINTPYPSPGRPRMFGSRAAQVLWVLLPIVTVGLAAAVPFVAAAVKGVIRPWLAVVYAVIEIGLFAWSTVTPDAAAQEPPLIGFALVLLVIVSATHTGLLDSSRVTIGK